MKHARGAVWATVFGVAGVLHFAQPKPFDGLVPEGLPGSPRFYTYASGVAELALSAVIAGCTAVDAAQTKSEGAAELAGERRQGADGGDPPTSIAASLLQDWVAPATAGFLLAVWPGNIKMAWDWRRKPWGKRSVAFARVPLQVPMVLSAAKLGR